MFLVSQLQLHDGGVKIHEIIYEQVRPPGRVNSSKMVLGDQKQQQTTCVRIGRPVQVQLVFPSLQACRLLSDDYEQVRSAAVQMVWVLSQLYPER